MQHISGMNLIISVARTCNLIFIVLDVLKPLGDKKIIEGELEGFGIRLNKKPPSILVRKKDKGELARLGKECGPPSKEAPHVHRRNAARDDYTRGGERMRRPGPQNPER